MTNEESRRNELWQDAALVSIDSRIWDMIEDKEAVRKAIAKNVNLIEKAKELWTG